MKRSTSIFSVAILLLIAFVALVVNANAPSNMISAGNPTPTPTPDFLKADRTPRDVEELVEEEIDLPYELKDLAPDIAEEDKYFLQTENEDGSLTAYLVSEKLLEQTLEEVGDTLLTLQIPASQWIAEIEAAHEASASVRDAEETGESQPLPTVVETPITDLYQKLLEAPTVGFGTPQPTEP